jgi:hypothetical protein
MKFPCSTSFRFSSYQVHQKNRIDQCAWQLITHGDYLSMKEGSLFVLFSFVCTYEIYQTGMLHIVYLVSLESSWGGAVHGLISMAFWLAMQKVLEYWMISSLKIKLNSIWKFRRNWNVPLVLLERSWWAGFNGIYLVRFGFRMWEILIFKRFLPLKIQINSRKPGFGRKNQLRTW